MIDDDNIKFKKTQFPNECDWNNSIKLDWVF